MKAKNIVFKCLITLIIVLSIISLGSCNKQDNNNPPKEEEITIEKETYNILEGTIYETPVYIFRSSVAGPRLFIMGGTHGDEVAGWKTGLELLKKKDWHGTVMLIPQCNILADQLVQRYPGAKAGGNYNGITYQDLNRKFPGSADGTITQQIAYAISQEVIKFNPEYAIDLHESLANASQGRVGETLIYGNKKSALLAADITADFNETYIKEGEHTFNPDTNPPSGSFNNYFSTTLDIHVFTIETNRNLEESRRIEQQLQLLSVMFDYFWN